MRKLVNALKDADPGVVYAIAQSWKVRVDHLDLAEAVEVLAEAMLEADRTARMWGEMDADARGAVQLLAGSGHGMPKVKFEHVYGEIRRMGKGAIDREKPHINPLSVAEGLFYRGFIAESFEKTDTGMRPIIYIPEDLIKALPLHQTSYSNLQFKSVETSTGANQIDRLMEINEGDIENPCLADTSIVDDMTTLLAYLQVFGGGIQSDRLAASDRNRITPYLLQQEDNRLDFLLNIGISANLIAAQEEKAYLRRAEGRRWLGATRAEQLRWLVDAWFNSALYRDLWHVPGLYPEEGWSYDPLIARAAIRDFLIELAPKQGWWLIDELIDFIKKKDPDFQRPGSDYDRWYIQNEAGEYLHGLESWGAVEGALIYFILSDPMRWLGLMDVADDARRLTAYGRAFLKGDQWPDPPEQIEKIIVNSDGTFHASRKVARIDRFQLARFTTWEVTVQPYLYKLDAESIQRADRQGINTAHIAAFIQRQLEGEEAPPAIARLLSVWQSGAAARVTFEHLLVLRAASPEIMDRIFDNPATRRYLGARLGPMACVIRSDRWEQLRDALGETGISVDVLR